MIALNVFEIRLIGHCLITDTFDTSKVSLCAIFNTLPPDGELHPPKGR